MVQQFQQAPQPARRSRVKAESRYPVYDLNSSIEVARIIRDQGGGAADQPHLASFLNYRTTRSGAFITRIAAARLFGLIENRDQLLVPTSLANAIIAPEHPGKDDVRARLEAFWRVPLYRSLYERYKDTQLPPEAGLRNAMETLYNIPRSRTQLAYRVLMDSAGQAGLYEARGGARTHFVAPVVPEAGDEAAEQWAQTIPPDIADVRGDLAQPQPEMQTQVDPIRRLQQALVEKIRDVEASDLDTIKEYIRLIRQLDEGKEDEEPKK